MKIPSSKDKLELIKGSLPFKRFDLLVYALITVAIVLLFLFAVILPNNKPATGFKVYLNGRVIMSCTFSGEYQIDGEFTNFIEITSENQLTFKVFTDQDKTRYNVITVDLTEKSVRVTDANCSFNKDCAHSPAVSNSGAIVCAPHGLKIVPFGNDKLPAVTG